MIFCGSQYLEGVHLQRYCLTKSRMTLAVQRNYCLEGVPYTKYALFSILQIKILTVLCSPFYFSLYVIESNQMTRLITFTICGGAYLNFMGNEFGHPDVSVFSMCYPWKVLFMQLTIFSCARGWNSRCQAIISHFHVLTVDGILLQMEECIMIYMSLIRCTMISLHVIESAEIIEYTDYFFPT